uniref:50S ribosomal protein L35 n=1 Tax=Allokutzneria sp. NRRL B-24872 TaxID=1137961 RepID=UPI000A366437
MPKHKPHSGTKKRIKVTGTGKLLREQTGRRHILEKKPSTLTRRLEGTEVVAKA